MRSWAPGRAPLRRPSADVGGGLLDRPYRRGQAPRGSAPAPSVRRRAGLRTARGERWPRRSGQTVGSQRTALLFVERETATLAVVRTADGAVVRVISRSLPAVDPVTALQGPGGGTGSRGRARPGRLRGRLGVDIAALEPDIAAATDLPVHAPADGDLALAGGCAGRRQHSALRGIDRRPGLQRGHRCGRHPDGGSRVHGPLGYSAVPRTKTRTSSPTTGPPSLPTPRRTEPSRKSFVLLGSALSTVFVIGVAALAISLAVVIRPPVISDPNPFATRWYPASRRGARAGQKRCAAGGARNDPGTIPVSRRRRERWWWHRPRRVRLRPLLRLEAARAPAAPPPAPAHLQRRRAPAPASVSRPRQPVSPAGRRAGAVLLPPIFQGLVRTAPVPRTPRTTATCPTNSST